jgi:hypothetical protein
LARRRIRWPAIAVSLLMVAGAALLLLRPEVLAPLVTRLINRQLEQAFDGNLRVGSYRVRAFAGVDLTDVTLTLEGERGGLTLVAVDTLEVDFRLREVIGRTVRLQRLAASGVEIYHSKDPPPPGEPRPRSREFRPPRLEVGLLNLDDLRVEISNPDGRLEERIRDVSWRGEIRSEDDGLLLVIRSGGLDWVTRGTRLAQLYGTASLGEDGVTVEELRALWNGNRATVRGSVGGERGIDLVCSGRGISAAEVNELTGVDLEFDAVGDIDCLVVVRNDTVRFEGDFSGRFEDWELDGMRAEALISSGVAEFRTLRGGVGGAWFDGWLEVDARDDSDVVITLEGEGRDLDLQTGLIPGDATELPRTDGRGRLSIVHHSADESTVVRAALTAGEVEIMPFDSCRVEVWAREDSLHFRQIRLRHGSLQADLSGSSDRREIFRGRLELRVDDLRDLPPGWEWPEITGQASGEVELIGPLDGLTAAGRLRLDATALGPVAVGTGEAELVAERVLNEDWELSAAVTGQDFDLAGVALGDYLSWTRVTPASVAVDSFRTVRDDTVTTLRGRADISPGRADLSIQRLGVSLAGVDWKIDDPVTAAVGPGLVDLPEIHLASSRGDLVAAVRYSEADSLVDGVVLLENFDLNLLDPLLRQRLRTGGPATAEVLMGGRPGALELSVRGGLAHAQFPLARIDTLTVEASLLGGTVQVDTLDLVSEYGQVGLRGTISHPGAPIGEFWPGASLDLAVSVIDGQWSFVDQFELEALETIAGQVRGNLRVTGTTDDPLVTGTVESGPFHYQWLHLDRLTGSVRAEYDQLALGDLEGFQDELRLLGRLEIPMRFDLLSTPLTPEDGPFYGRLTVPPGTDLAPLQQATDAFTRISGRGSGEIIVSGPLARPRYQGEMEVQDAGFVLRGNEEIFSECSAQGVFSDDRLILQRIEGREGLRGTFSGVGHVVFEGLQLRTWDITFQADRFLVATIPDLRVLLRTRNGRLQGKPLGPENTLVPEFTGDYEVIKGRYTGNFSGPEGGIDPTLGNIFPDWLANLRITGPPRSFRIMNRSMELDLSGDLSLVRTADGMILGGGMNIDKGRLPVFNNTFEVVRGRLDFSRRVGVQPNVDIDAETRVRLRGRAAASGVVERITVHAAGPANAMEISFSSESGYPREAIERMLLGLAPYPDEQADQGALANASIGAGLNLIEREVAQEIDIVDTIEIDQIQRQQAGNPSFEPLIGVGKYLGSDLYVKYAQGLNQNDRDIVVEYQISNHLLLQTEIRRRIDEYQGDATYNFDIKYRFEY